jgi:mannose-6-phosphate isomerase-like protein (cupin superfamily)
MPILDLADAPVTATTYGRWQALNRPLGITAFGLNAMVCDPGEPIDTAHDETDSGQQEVYVVVAGRIEFTLGGVATEAGPCTIVSAPDPSVPRSFRPLEPGTRVVCVGAAPAGDAPAFGEWIGEAAVGGG